MKLLPKVIIFLFFSLLALSSSLLVKSAKAVDPIPPKGRIPCLDGTEANPEFNSLRPYQASPCGDSDKALFCANAIIIYVGFSGTSPREGLQATHKPVSEKIYTVTISDTELPFYGNTEQTTNSTTPTDTFDDATKLNEYVSWYLSGVNGRAEYGNVTNDQIINYSGPLKKLLPSIIQDAARIKAIENATILSTVQDTENPTIPSDGTGGVGGNIQTLENHNQIVTCGTQKLVFDNFLGIIPVPRFVFTGDPCYPNGNGGKAQNEKRLKDWVGTLSIPRAAVNMIKYLLQYYPGFDGSFIDTLLAQPAWNSKEPPLPWDPSFKDYRDYLKAYQEWKGKTCILLPPILGYTLPVPICIDNPLVTNEYADLFQYVPLVNTSDRSAKMPIQGVQVEGLNGTEIDIQDPKYKIIREPVNMFAHTLEDKQSLDLLAKTYMPTTCKDGICAPIASKVDYNTVESGKTDTGHCRITDVRTNQGDNLFTDLGQSEISVKVSPYNVTQWLCDEPIDDCKQSRRREDTCTGKIVAWGCHATVMISINSYSKHPYANEVWNTAVANSTSVFRKIYPQVGPNSPVSCIADIPGVTNAVYTPSDDTPKDFNVLNPEGRRVDPQSAQLYFPHIGGVYEYFLKGIQTALRPKGYGEQVPNGNYCLNSSCGDLPTLPKASGTCQMGNTKVGQLPQTLKDIISAAAQTYKVPPNLIVGVMFGEGAFNSNKYLDEQDVKNWATCTPITNCSGPLSSIVQFQGTWDTLAQRILPDLKKIDPKKTKADPCNLLDATFALAKDLHDNAGGSPSMTGNSCYGIEMNSTNPTSCTWDNKQYETAIRVWEIGTVYDVGQQKTCLTTPGTCASGLPSDSTYTQSLCPGGDNCEKFRGSGNTSHNACVFDVATDGGSGNRN